MSIEIPSLLRLPVRFIYKLFGGAALVGLGFPWCAISLYIFFADPDLETPPILSVFVWGLGLPVNCAIFLYLLHGSGALVGSLAPWEFGILGWSFGMGFLLICAWLEQANKCGKKNGDCDDAKNRLCAKLLKAFGVEGVKNVDMGMFMWVIPLVATLFSLAAYFVASWLSYPQTVLECSDVRLPADSAAELCLELHGSMKAILDHRNHCCYVVDHTFDLIQFLSCVGGNVVAGYGIVKIFGSVGVAAAPDDVELEPGRFAEKCTQVELNVDLHENAPAEAAGKFEKAVEEVAAV